MDTEARDARVDAAALNGIDQAQTFIPLISIKEGPSLVAKHPPRTICTVSSLCLNTSVELCVTRSEKEYALLLKITYRPN